MSGLFKMLAMISYALLGAALLVYATQGDAIIMPLAFFAYGIAGCMLVYFFFKDT